MTDFDDIIIDSGVIIKGTLLSMREKAKVQQKQYNTKT